MQKREKILVVFTLLLVSVMISKSLFFDEIVPRNSDEVKFKSFVEKRIEDGKEELGLFGKTGLVTYRVVKIEKIDEDKTSEIIYYDKDKQSYVEGTVDGDYKARVRGYILHVIPYKEFSVGLVN